MDSHTSQVSFIPKSPLTRGESFLERPRPRSLLGFITVLAFLASVGSYAGLYFYNNTLNRKIESLTAEINEVQKSFNQPEINQARVFYARAELVRTLIASHIVVNPIFDFLEANTTTNIFYSNLVFKKGAEGTLSLEVTGEAQGYASLAYQADVFRQKSKELASFSVKDIKLTNLGGVSFSFVMTFAPEYLSYSTQLAMLATRGVAGEFSEATTSPSQDITPPMEESSHPQGETEILPEVSCTAPLVRIVQSDGSVACGRGEVVPANASWLSSLWEEFKFW